MRAYWWLSMGSTRWMYRPFACYSWFGTGTVRRFSKKVYPLMYFRRRLTCIFVIFAFLFHAHGYHEDNVKGRALVYMTFLMNKHILQKFSPHPKDQTFALAHKRTINHCDGSVSAPPHENPFVINIRPRLQLMPLALAADTAGTALL